MAPRLKTSLRVATSAAPITTDLGVLIHTDVVRHASLDRAVYSSVGAAASGVIEKCDISDAVSLRGAASVAAFGTSTGQNLIRPVLVTVVNSAD